MFTVPTKTSDGTTFSHTSFEMFLSENFDGFTKYPGTYYGSWVDKNKTHYDDNCVYEVNVGSIVQGGKIAEAVEYAKNRYDQKAIYVKYMGISEIL